MITVISYWDLFHFLISFLIDQFFQVYFFALYFSGRDWTGLEWTIALGFYGLGMFRIEIHCNLLAWMGLHLSGRDWTGLDGTALDCYRLCLTSPDCITLHCLGLNWKSPYRIVCIALDFTWKDCSGFRKDRLNHVFFKASARRAYLRQFAFRAHEMQQWKSCKLSLNCSLT